MFKAKRIRLYLLKRKNPQRANILQNLTMFKENISYFKHLLVGEGKEHTHQVKLS